MRGQVTPLADAMAGLPAVGADATARAESAKDVLRRLLQVEPRQAFHLLFCVCKRGSPHGLGSGSHAPRLRLLAAFGPLPGPRPNPPCRRGHGTNRLGSALFRCHPNH